MRSLFVLLVLGLSVACSSSDAQKTPIINTSVTPTYDVGVVYNKNFNITYQSDAYYTARSVGTLKTTLTDDLSIKSNASTLLCNLMTFHMSSTGRFLYKMDLNGITYMASRVEQLPNSVKVGDSGVISVIPIYSGKIINLEYKVLDNVPAGIQYVLIIRETQNNRDIYCEMFYFTIINNNVTDIRVEANNYENNSYYFFIGKGN